MNDSDLHYYLGRVRAEEAAAAIARSPEAARAHSLLADEYLSLLEANGFNAPQRSAAAR
jgi:hypothetical protein